MYLALALVSGILFSFSFVLLVNFYFRIPLHIITLIGGKVLLHSMSAGLGRCVCLYIYMRGLLFIDFEPEVERGWWDERLSIEQAEVWGDNGTRAVLCTVTRSLQCTRTGEPTPGNLAC